MNITKSICTRVAQAFAFALAIAVFSPANQAHAIACIQIHDFNAAETMDCAGNEVVLSGGFVDGLFPGLHLGNDWFTDFHVTTPEGTEITAIGFFTETLFWDVTVMGNKFWAVAPSLDARINPTDTFSYEISYSSLNGMITSGTVIIEYTMDVVPEPGTLALFGLGLAGLGLARRKRKAA